MNHSKKVCAPDKVIVALNADKDKDLDYETTSSGNIIGNVCVRCHDSDIIESLGLPKQFNIYDGGYVRVTFPEMLVLKENANKKLLVDDEGRLPAAAGGNMLPEAKAISSPSL